MGGHMGREVASLVLSGYRGTTLAAGVDVNGYDGNAVCHASLGDVTERCDCIIDFSHRSATASLLEYAVAHNLPVVLCTTGHTEEEITAIRQASAYIPVLYSRNMSLGINLLLELVQRAAAVLGEEYNVEIVEAHHNKKLDAPSGTALMLADAIRDVREESEYVYDRHSVRRERAPEEIGIHSVRGGTIVGEHEVIFAGTDEVIRISHSAYSRDVFATGAVRAALFAAEAKPGMYSMKEMLAAEKAE
jgi:4-hydroxy-tetrahydrodipicolinate reductase